MEGNDTLGIGPIESRDKYNQPTSTKKKGNTNNKNKKMHIYFNNYHFGYDYTNFRCICSFFNY